MNMLLITIGRLRPAGIPALERYAAGVVPLLAALGAEVIARGQPVEAIVGDADGQPDLVAVIRFPTEDAIREFLESDRYRACLNDRAAAFADLRSYIAADLLGNASSE